MAPDHEDGDLVGGGETDEDPPLTGTSQVNAADPFDPLAGEPVVCRAATPARQVGLESFHPATNVRAETPNVLFSDSGPEDIEADGQLVGRLWT